MSSAVAARRPKTSQRQTQQVVEVTHTHTHTACNMSPITRNPGEEHAVALRCLQSLGVGPPPWFGRVPGPVWFIRIIPLLEVCASSLCLCAIAAESVLELKPDFSHSWKKRKEHLHFYCQVHSIWEKNAAGNGEKMWKNVTKSERHWRWAQTLLLKILHMNVFMCSFFQSLNNIYTKNWI